MESARLTTEILFQRRKELIYYSRVPEAGVGENPGGTTCRICRVKTDVNLLATLVSRRPWWVRSCWYNLTASAFASASPTGFQDHRLRKLMTSNAETASLLASVWVERNIRTTPKSSSSVSGIARTHCQAPELLLKYKTYRVACHPRRLTTDTESSIEFQSGNIIVGGQGKRRIDACAANRNAESDIRTTRARLPVALDV